MIDVNGHLCYTKEEADAYGIQHYPWRYTFGFNILEPNSPKYIMGDDGVVQPILGYAAGVMRVPSCCYTKADSKNPKFHVLAIHDPDIIAIGNKNYDIYGGTLNDGHKQFCHHFVLTTGFCGVDAFKLVWGKKSNKRMAYISGMLLANRLIREEIVKLAKEFLEGAGMDEDWVARRLKSIGDSDARDRMMAVKLAAEILGMMPIPARGRLLPATGHVLPQLEASPTGKIEQTNRDPDHGDDLDSEDLPG